MIALFPVKNLDRIVAGSFITPKFVVWDVFAKKEAPPPPHFHFKRLDFLHISYLTFQKSAFSPQHVSCQVQKTSKKVCSWSEGKPF